MMNDTVPLARFFSYRTLFGLLAGIVTALIYIIFFRQPGLYTPILSLIIASWISKLSMPKHLAGLGAIISVPAGIAAIIQIILKETHTLDIPTIIGIYLNASFIFIGYFLYFVLIGFVCAQLLKLYRRGTLF